MKFIYYNQQKGALKVTEQKETIYNQQWACLSINPVSERVQIDFIKYVSLVFDFENRPENNWSYVSNPSHYPTAGFLRDVLERFKTRALYDEVCK